MGNDIVGALAAFAVGIIISFGNYRLSEFFLKKHPDRFSAVSVIRQLIQVLYIVLIFFSSGRLPWDRTYLLVGAALGITLPMFFFTYKLLKTNKESTSDASKKEDKENG